MKHIKPLKYEFKTAKIVKTAIVKIELEYQFNPNVSDEDIKWEIENMELPENYKENSWEFVKIIND